MFLMNFFEDNGVLKEIELKTKLNKKDKITIDFLSGKLFNSGTYGADSTLKDILVKH